MGLYVQSNKKIFFLEKFTSIQIFIKNKNTILVLLKNLEIETLVQKLTDHYCIPPIFHENDFAIDFQEKAKVFNKFFAK